MGVEKIENDNLNVFFSLDFTLIVCGEEFAIDAIALAGTHHQFEI